MAPTVSTASTTTMAPLAPKAAVPVSVQMSHKCSLPMLESKVSIASNVVPTSLNYTNIGFGQVSG
jgi:hypothetical protein